MEASRWWCHPGLARPHSAVAVAAEAPLPVLVSRAPGGGRLARAAAPYLWPAAPSAPAVAVLAVTARPLHVGRSRPPTAAAAADTPALVPDAAGDLPDGFEFPAAHRPRLPHDAFDDLAVPVLDLAALSAAAAEPLDAADSSSPLAALRRACEGLGLFQLVNHGFPAPLASRLRRVGRGFFRRPHAAKQTLATGRRFLGYTSGVPNASGGRMWRESFGVRLVLGRQTSGASPSPLATRLAAAATGADDDAAVVAEYAVAMEAVARRVLECMARSLGLPTRTLAQHFQGNRTALVSMNHYPPCPAPDRALGFFVHTDPFALTIVHQDDDGDDGGAGAMGDAPPPPSLGGLQVQDAEGEWRGVRPVPGALVVNLGDLVQAWTNDRFVSAQHRVAAPPPGDRSRLSLCFFYSPARDAVVEAPQALVEAAAGKRRRYYRRFEAIEFAREVDAVGAGARGHVLRRFRVDSAGDQDDD